MADGWFIKKLHRLILLSQTYQQACGPPFGPRRSQNRAC